MRRCAAADAGTPMARTPAMMKLRITQPVVFRLQAEPGTGRTASSASKHVRCMCANRKVELKQPLVGVQPFGKIRPAILRPNLAELGRPEREKRRPARVDERPVEHAAGPIESRAD